MGLLDQLQAYIQANTPRNTRKPVSVAQVMDEGLLGGRIGQMPQRAAEMQQGLLRIPQDLAQLASPQMSQQVNQAMSRPQQANPQQWMDAGMELSGMAPIGGLVGATKGAGLLDDGIDGIVESIKRKHGVDISAQLENGNVYLGKIQVPQNKRGQGIGTAAMNDLVGQLDDLGYSSTLSPSPIRAGNNIDVPKEEQDRLIKFYKKFGYNVARDEFDDEFGRFVDMKRQPKKNK